MRLGVVRRYPHRFFELGQALALISHQKQRGSQPVPQCRIVGRELDALAQNRHEVVYLASGDEAGNLRVWGISAGESVIWETYPTGIQSLAFSPNGAYLAVALWDATIQILHWRNQQ